MVPVIHPGFLSFGSVNYYNLNLL